MKTSLKKLFFWSSLGSLFFGASVAFARKKQGPKSVSACQNIPHACRRIDVWTELAADENDKGMLCREHYVLRPTSFKVWSILELPTSPGQPNPTGAAVYHVTFLRLVEKPGDTAAEESEEERSRYYGTVSVLARGGKSCSKNSLARGAILEIRKCYVGGASNGVETGEIHRSSAPILNYRFEYGPDPRE